LNKKLHAKIQQAKQTSKQQQDEAKAKVDAMEKKAAKAKGETKAKIEARIADIKKKSNKSKETYDQLQKEELD
jgi:signal transduction histidine kinase